MRLLKQRGQRSSRWRWFTYSSILLLAIYAVIIEPRWVAKRQIEVLVPQWQGPANLRVAVASDWHFTKKTLWRVMTVDRARAIVQEINNSKPDVILLPGDFIADRDYKPDREATAEDEIAKVLGELKAPLGVYAVLGNHDWWHEGPAGKLNSGDAGGLAFMRALRQQGIKVLENQAIPLTGTNIWIAGIGDDHTGHSQPELVRKQLPANAQALVMMHDPASLMQLPKISGLLVAGHTHGGQVNLPFIGALVVPGKAPNSWAYGWIPASTQTNGNTAYVTSGLGVSILPVRFNMRPEWVMFTINGSVQ